MVYLQSEPGGRLRTVEAAVRNLGKVEVEQVVTMGKRLNLPHVVNCGNLTLLTVRGRKSARSRATMAGEIHEVHS